mmetsp:Transcript_38002/g.89585  ORF Transcript_38002/g.89585 Transcript_38002/m.89585 type:complete len:274 (+) Transcript_38002:28-849(+)
MKQLATQTMLTPIGAELAEARGGVPRIRPDVKVAARIKYMLGVRVAATAAGVLHVLHDSHELVDLERSVAEVVEVALQHVRHLLHPPEVVQRLRSRLECRVRAGVGIAGQVRVVEVDERIELAHQRRERLVLVVCRRLLAPLVQRLLPFLPLVRKLKHQVERVHDDREGGEHEVRLDRAREGICKTGGVLLSSAELGKRLEAHGGAHHVMRQQRSLGGVLDDQLDVELVLDLLSHHPLEEAALLAVLRLDVSRLPRDPAKERQRQLRLLACGW